MYHLRSTAEASDWLPDYQSQEVEQDDEEWWYSEAAPQSWPDTFRGNVTCDSEYFAVPTGESTRQKHQFESYAATSRSTHSPYSRRFVFDTTDSDTSEASGPIVQEVPEPKAPRRRPASVMEKFSADANTELIRLSALERNDVRMLGEPLNEERNFSPTTGRLQIEVRKLLRAQTACEFDKAVHAAELAARKAETGRIEQEAVKGAQSQVTGRTTIVETFKETVPGEREIQVIGYVGITKPRAT